MNKDNFFEDIQSYLSIGYLYLIVLGLLNETLYYNQLGINVLNYSSILDVLISPIARLTSSVTILLMFSFLTILVFIGPSYLAKRRDSPFWNKFVKMDGDLTKEEVQKGLQKTFIFMFALGLSGFFVGTGLGKGERLLKKMESGELMYNDKIVFTTADEQAVEIVGKNSNYIFYLLPNQETLQISPIAGTIKSIEHKK